MNLDKLEFLKKKLLILLIPKSSDNYREIFELDRLIGNLKI